MMDKSKGRTIPNVIYHPQNATELCAHILHSALQEMPIFFFTSKSVPSTKYTVTNGLQNSDTHHFTPRGRLYGDLMSPATIKRT
jgi:hypothetical protein